MHFRFAVLRPLSQISAQSISKTTTAPAQRLIHLHRSCSSLLGRSRSRYTDITVASHSNKSVRAYSTPMAVPTDTAAEEVANNTGITPDSLAQTLREKLDATHVEIQDISGGCGASFSALIVSPQFQGKAALARHRLVNTALKAEIAAIHAWTPKCLTPEQWEQQKSQQ